MLADILNTLSKEELVDLFNEIEYNTLIKITLRSGNEKLFNYVSGYDFKYDISDIYCCPNKTIVAAVVNTLSKERATKLLKYITQDGYHVGDHDYFDILMGSGKISLDQELLIHMSYYGYHHGIKYFVRNGITCDKLFDNAISNHDIETMDLLFVYDDINNIDFMSLMKFKHHVALFKMVVKCLISYGYDIIGRFNELTEKQKSEMSETVYVYFHDKGLYFNEDLLRKYPYYGSCSKLYWNTPSHVRKSMTKLFKKVNFYCKPSKYANKLTSNKKTDITIVCLDD